MNDDAVLQVLQNTMLAHAKAQEDQLDAQIQEIDNMTEDDFETLRERRRLALIKQHEQKQEWKAMGHGSVNQLADQPAFFKAMNGKSENVICLFYTNTNDYGKLFERHFQALAPKHLESYFCMIDAEKAPYLCENLSIFMMPTVLLVKKGKVVHQIKGLDELGGEKFSTEWLEWYTAQFKVLKCDKPQPDSPFIDGAEKFVNLDRQQKKTGSIKCSDYNDDDDDFWD
jgi:hypothetical protein